MNKDDSQIIKGIAVLMMLFGHLMSNATDAVSYSFFLGNTPLAMWIKPAMPPVPFFLFISGYGLNIVNRGGVDKHRFSRVLRLYISLWIVLAIFVPIGCFVKSDTYPGDLMTVIGNLTAVNPSYDTAMWFLVPYVILSIAAPYLFAILDRFKLKYTFPVIYVVSLSVAWIVPRQQPFLNSHHLLYCFIESFALLLPFMTGAICAKYNIMSKWKNYCHEHSYIPRLSIFFILILGALICSVKITPIAFLYVPTIIALVIVTPKVKVIDATLKYIGKYSMGMWMCHSYYYILFPDYLYSLKYPLVIFAALVAISLITSIVVQSISDRVYKLLPIKH